MAAFCCQSIQAQTNGSNSSYSRFGLGTLNDQSQGFNKAMGGAGLGVRIGNRINMQNPASYSAIDSLSFIFDMGVNLSVGHLSQAGSSVNVRNCSLDFVNAGLRLTRGLGLSFGFVPFSTIGYNFSSESKVTNDFTSTQPVYSTSSYKGEGGLHQIYLGLGWNPFADLSIGVNASYLWGTYYHSMVQTFGEGSTSTSASGYSNLNSVHNARLRTYKIDLGVQYPVRLTAKDVMTIGATAGLGHNIKSDATLTRFTTAGDSLQVVADAPFDLPYTYGIGIGWQREENILVAADVRQERWAECHAPEMSTAGGVLSYTAEKGAYKNRTKITIGAQYTPKPLDKHYYNRIQYRIGANYSTPYLKINGLDGPKEYGLSLGAGLPITNKINNRSVVNIGFQWFRRKASGNMMITEDYFMFNAGITFNERWFMKFKIN